MDQQLKKEGFAGQKLHVIPSATLKKAMGHPLCKNLYITDIGYYPNAKFHNRERVAGCQQHILIYCAKGKGWCQVNDTLYEIAAHQMVILPQQAPHKYGADTENPWTIYWVHFDGPYAASMISHLLKVSSFRAVDVPFNEARDTLFEKIYALLEMADNMDNMVDALLAFPYYLTSFGNSGANQRLELPDNDPIGKSIVFMKAHLAGAITLQALANQACLSVSHYCTLFQEKTHNSPVRYFVFLKMQYACQLLENTSLSVKQIGVALGFDDQFHFSRVFTKMIGVSPRGFRKR
ncbi:helix-turn-helix domain-containing protein [Parasediminibacterium sp. JCM 36343]|uniref:AraC family transcriptional regulator n=1 Tax=Parasediminibacterium sp. JCM 36343 TaxID=3374279 RepID=UPI00397D0678